MRMEEARQKKLKTHEPPVLISTTIDAKIEALRKPFNKLKGKRKPKPPPTPKANSTVTDTGPENPVEEETGNAEENLSASVEIPLQPGLGNLEEGAGEVNKPIKVSHAVLCQSSLMQKS